MLPWLRNLSKEMLQQVYLRDRFLWRLPADTEPLVALTFDDGPHPVHTPAVLDLLARHNIPATFFVIGQRVREHPEVVRRILAQGHGIGGHTYGHREIVGLAANELAQELQTCRQAIQDAASVDTLLFRPPRGRIDLPSIRRVTSLGYRIVHWSKTYSDYRCDDSEELFARIRRDPARGRDIVLLHDQNPVTVEALAAAIPFWRTQGLVFQRL